MKLSLFPLLAALLAVFAVPALGAPTPGCFVSKGGGGGAPCTPGSSRSSSTSPAASPATSSAGSVVGMTYGGGSKGSTPERRSFDEFTYKSIHDRHVGKVSGPKRRGGGRG